MARRIILGLLIAVLGAGSAAVVVGLTVASVTGRDIPPGVAQLGVGLAGLLAGLLSGPVFASRDTSRRPDDHTDRQEVP